MQRDEAPEIDIETPPPGLQALVGQLKDDALAFAKAESEWLKAEAGDRAGVAKPGLAAIGAGLALALGVVMAIPVGLMLVLTPLIGAGWSLLAVVAAFLLISAILIRFGGNRVKTAFKPRNDR
jgi:hypothetical protein